MAGRRVIELPNGAQKFRAALCVDLPSDIHIRVRPPAGGTFSSRAEFETALQIRGLRQDRVIRALQHPEVQRCLHAAAAEGAIVEIARGFAMMVFSEEHTPSDLRQNLANDLARAFDIAWRSPWENVVQTLGLVWNRAQLSGVVEDVSMTASEVATPEGWRVEIIGQLDPPLDEGFKVVRGKGGMKVGDLMLDAVLRVEAADPDQARALLNRPGVRTGLLELIHGHPASRITHTEIVVSVARWLTDEELQRYLPMVAALARALRP